MIMDLNNYKRETQEMCVSDEEVCVCVWVRLYVCWVCAREPFLCMFTWACVTPNTRFQQNIDNYDV